MQTINSTIQAIPVPRAQQTTLTPLAAPSTYTAATTPGAVNSTAAVAAAAPTAGVVNATQDMTKGTVAGQIKGLIDANSPLMQQAETAGKQYAAERGLLGSSMAAGAVQDSLYRTALPIANADAGFNNQFALTNAGEANTTNRFNTGNQQQVNLTNAANVQQTNQSNADTANKVNILNTEATNASKQFAAQQANAMATTQAQLDATAKQFNTSQSNAFVINQMDQTNKIQLADIQATYQNQIQGSASATSLFDGSMKSIAAIIADPNMSAESKQNAVTQQTTLLKAGLSMVGAMANLDITALLKFKP